MLDPFPPPPQWLARATAPVASYLNLPTLPLHIHEILGFAIFYQVLYKYGAPAISRRLVPSYYSSFNKRTQINWDVHIVSFVQSLIVCGFALWTIREDAERAQLGWQGRVFGYTGSTGVVQALGAGYFVWDFFMCLKYINIFGPGMLAHAISALSVFTLGFRPFVNYYAPVFILYELSSPFLNIHWACDKLNLTGSIYQLINGVALIFVFFTARLCYGTYQSFSVAYDVYTAMRLSATDVVLAEAPFSKGVATEPSTNELAEILRFYDRSSIPLWLPAVYLGSNLVLNGLNWYWFGKMITTIKARFDPDAKKVAEQKRLEHEEPVKASGVKGQGQARKRRA